MKRYFEILSAYFGARDRGRILILLAAVCIVYLPFLGNPFIFDDVNIFSAGFTYRYSHYYQHTQYGLIFDFRWLPYASLGWTTRLFSDIFPQPFRIGNVLLHFANVIILFQLLRSLLGAVLREQSQSTYITWGAWLGALAFAVHPVSVYAAGYIAQRSILMATLFALLMQWAYLRGLLSGQARWLVLTVLAYFLACFSKEHSIMMPAILAAMTLLLRKENRVSNRVLSLTWGAIVLIALLVVLVAKGVIGVQVFGASYEVMATQMFKQQNIVESGTMLYLLSVMTQAGLYFKYLLLWLVPNPAWMSIDMRETFVSSISEWQGWIGAAGFVLYGFVAIRLLLCGGIKGLVGFALICPWVLFFTEFSSVRVQEPFVLYRSYLWMPGMMLLIPLLLMRFPQRKPLLIIACVTILLIPLAWNRLWMFGDNFRLWNEAALMLENGQVAGANRIYYNRGLALMAAQKWDDAVSDFERTAAISPELEPVRYNLGVAYSYAGRYEDALVQYDAAIAIKDDDGGVYFAKGFTLKRLHRDKEAILQMERSCKLKNVAACVIVAIYQQKQEKRN